jgi:hypothetical protein
LFWLWQNDELAVIAGKHIPGNALSPVDFFPVPCRFFPCRFLALFWPVTVVLVLSRAATVLVLVIGPAAMTARSNGNQRKDVGRFINGVAESKAEAGSRVDYDYEHESQHVSQNEKTPEQGRLLERSN